MAKSDAKRRTAEPEKPRKSTTEPKAPSKGDGLAHDIDIVDLEPPDDLKRNPGIGASKGTTMSGTDADDLDDAMGDNTFEGDVESDATLGGGADPRRSPRHNK